MLIVPWWQHILRWVWIPAKKRSFTPVPAAERSLPDRLLG
jgi:hypothetical protein